MGEAPASPNMNMVWSMTNPTILPDTHDLSWLKPSNFRRRVKPSSISGMKAISSRNDIASVMRIAIDPAIHPSIVQWISNATFISGVC